MLRQPTSAVLSLAGACKGLLASKSRFWILSVGAPKSLCSDALEVPSGALSLACAAVDPAAAFPLAFELFEGLEKIGAGGRCSLGFSLWLLLPFSLILSASLHCEDPFAYHSQYEYQ